MNRQAEAKIWKRGICLLEKLLGIYEHKICDKNFKA
jgi:hypothetical protein